MTEMKILVANRGEIATRILRTCREMNLPSVAVFTGADETALHVRYADEAVNIGDNSNYLNPAAILEAARLTGAKAVHPGYGFLSENPAFVKAVEDAGLVFIGPRSETTSIMGDKLSARRFAKEAGLPVIPGTDEPIPQDIPLGMAKKVKYPVLVKAAAGGGGRGIRLARSADELPGVIAAARSEALAAFGDDTVFLESLVQQARHIEVQILGDGKGKVLCLGERECSIQRRRQKLIEEAPAHGLPASIRSQLYAAAANLGKKLKYNSLGTVEFLLDAENHFYFIEVNPRIQVEHPVTEMVTGIDLVKEQLSLACGEGLHYRQEDINLRGAAIEARVLAEDTKEGFMPSTGLITYLKEPGGPGIRIDSALYQGLTIGADYDSLLAKVIAWDVNRPAAIQRLRRALNEFQIGGISTDIDFLLQIIESPQFMEGNVTTTYLESFQPAPQEIQVELERELAWVAALYARQQQAPRVGNDIQQPNRWQMAAWKEQMSGNY